MSTDNPKVSAYVPTALKTRLTQFREERNISESQAVIIILTEYFGLQQELGSPSNVVVGGVTLARMEAMERQINDLSKLIEKLSKSEPLSELPLVPTNIENSNCESDVILSDKNLNNSINLCSEPPNSLLSDALPEPIESKQLQLPLYNQELNINSLNSEIPHISGTKLSQIRFGMSKDALAQKKMKLTPDDLIAWTKDHDPDGIGWKPASNPKEGYVVADELPSELKSRLLDWMEKNNLLP